MAPKASPPAKRDPLTPIRNLVEQVRAAIRASRADLTYGTSARLLSVLLLYPLDVAKSRLQISTTPRLPLSSLRFVSLYAGAPAAILGQLPYGAITFGVFTVLRNRLREERPHWSSRSVAVASAVVADAVGSLWLAPFEAAKLRVQTGVAATLVSSARFGAAYTGWVGQLMRDAPHRALQIVAYEQLRQRYEKRVDRDIKGPEGAVIGAGVGMAVAAVTTPLDVIRTRVMAQRPGTGAAYGNWPSCLVKTLSHEGVGGLFRGLLPRVVYMGASVALFSIGYEASKAVIKDYVANKGGAAEVRFAKAVVRTGKVDRRKDKSSDISQVFVDAPRVE